MTVINAKSYRQNFHNVSRLHDIMLDVIVLCWALAWTSPAMGHWGTCPSTSYNILFSSLRSRIKFITANSILFPVLYIAWETCEIGNARRSITFRKRYK